MNQITVPNGWKVRKNTNEHFAAGNDRISIKVRQQSIGVFDVELMDFSDGFGDGAKCLERHFIDRRQTACEMANMIMRDVTHVLV